MRIFASFSSGVNAIATGTFIDMCAIKPKTTTQLEIFHNEENKNRLRSFKGLVYARENQKLPAENFRSDVAEKRETTMSFS